MAKCESCGKRINRNREADKFDDEFGCGAYEYKFQWNTFCFDCAKDILEYDDGDGVPDGCRECGGDYPHCTSSCPLYDD